VKDTAVELVLSQLYRVVFPDEASRVYSDLTNGIKALAPADVKDSWLARASRFIRTEGVVVLKGLTDRTREIVRDVLTDALERGLGIQEAAKELRQQVAQVSRSRAEAIVRSELVAASNAGSLQGAQSTGLRLQKKWLATNGARTRESHRIANGQLQPLDGFFSVGQGQGRYPGDPLLPIGERVRCRCTVTYKPIN
jgi:SPP1 gp7 family putative phage head morphogenesis protein